MMAPVFCVVTGSPSVSNMATAKSWDVLITICAGEVVVVGAGAGAVVEGAEVGAGPGAVPVVVRCADGGGPFPGAKCELVRADASDSRRGSLGLAREAMATVRSAWRRATPTLWAAAAAPQIITIGLAVATALTAIAATRNCCPETTCPQFAVAPR
jgi:hypothetical protein